MRITTGGVIMEDGEIEYVGLILLDGAPNTGGLTYAERVALNDDRVKNFRSRIKSELDQWVKEWTTKIKEDDDARHSNL